MDCLTSIFAGLVIFSIIGYMAFELGKDVSEVAAEGMYVTMVTLRLRVPMLKIVFTQLMFLEILRFKMECPWLYSHNELPFQGTWHSRKRNSTVMTLSFRTDLPGQTVQTQIRLLLEEQSDTVWSGSTLFAIQSALFGLITLW